MPHRLYWWEWVRKENEAPDTRWPNRRKFPCSSKMMTLATFGRGITLVTSARFDTRRTDQSYAAPRLLLDANPSRASCIWSQRHHEEPPNSEGRDSARDTSRSYRGRMAALLPMVPLRLRRRFDPAGLPFYLAEAERKPSGWPWSGENSVHRPGHGADASGGSGRVGRLPRRGRCFRLG